MVNSYLNYSKALLNLILSLNKTEKRYFKLYGKRNSSLKFSYEYMILFRVITKYKTTENDAIGVYFKNHSAKQLSDLKRNLFTQILNCLKHYNSENDGFKINKQIVMAKILYKKGLYLDALSFLKKIKNKALNKQNHLAVYEIIDFEKKIEGRHITRSYSERSLDLENETKFIREILKSEADWSDFSLKLYAKFIKKGHLKNKNEYIEISRFFQENKPKIRTNQNNLFLETLYRYQSYQWFYFITQNFKMGYKYCLLWIQLFDRFPEFKNSNPEILIKGLHNCLTILFNTSDMIRHDYYYTKLKKIGELDYLDTNTKMEVFIYLNTAKLNKIFLTGKFSDNKIFLKNLEDQLLNLESKIDDYRMMVIWYKMASIYFTTGEYSNCNKLLNKIINPNQKKLREDLQCFARLLDLFLHFELKNNELLLYNIKSTYRFMLSMNQSTKLHEILIDFFRTSIFKNEENLKTNFSNLKLKLEDLNNDHFEKRLFLYLDIISWLESKIQSKSVEQIIFNKRKNKLASIKMNTI